MSTKQLTPKDADGDAASEQRRKIEDRSVKPGLEKINEWNATKRFSRAYLDDDEDAAIEMDLDLAVGMDKTFELWTLMLDQYKQFVGYAN